ncbi:conserved protein of unknown function [Ectopseudomonas oleovorans]|uniref:Uncharacterized protein n=1 Tax=Ectopseudomonas oleovorans TaxID=301 RepID=A0A653B6F9_ECTOL|nr:conserved protein of unknown function [Pseudomonas oleovorans]
MPQTSALYGFEFTRCFSAAGLLFQPIESNHTTAKQLARTLNAHKLTGTVSGPRLTKETLFQLEGVLSFIEHLDVLVSDPENAEDAVDNPRTYFESEYTVRPRNSGGGAVLGSDAFNPWRGSRQLFIELALNHLADEQFCQSTRFKSLLFKCVETFRQRQPFLEISYFLLFSGLEAFARAIQNDYQSRNAAIPIAKTLQSYGFVIHQDNPKDLARSVSTYLHIRNALFHQGDFSKTVQINDDSVILNCSDYLFNLSMLVSLTIMKAIGFDDGHTNWDCWIDRQLHK